MIGCVLGTVVWLFVFVAIAAVNPILGILVGLAWFLWLARRAAS